MHCVDGVIGCARRRKGRVPAVVGGNVDLAQPHVRRHERRHERETESEIRLILEGRGERRGEQQRIQRREHVEGARVQPTHVAELRGGEHIDGGDALVVHGVVGDDDADDEAGHDEQHRHERLR